MTTNLKEREERIRALKENLIISANKRISEKVSEFSNREKNLLLNDFEYSLGKIILESIPEGIGIGAHYHCNAKCIFCLGGNPKLFSLQRYKEFFEPRLGSVISKARYVNFCGYGELLLMPQIEEFIDYVNGKIPEVNKIYTTNGTPLINNKVLDLLLKSKSAVQISLHASNGQLYRILTRLDVFDQIISQIRQLSSLRKSKERPTIILVFLANTLNIENLPDFVKFAASLGVDEILCNYMTVFHYAHLKFSCFFNQKIANESFKKAEEVARKANIPLKLPPRFGADTRVNRAPLCSDPWKYFYVENEGSVLPCCFAGSHFGYMDNLDFETIWNGANYKHLRSALINGPVHKWCKYCYKYRSSNVNELYAHINFKPGNRERILKGYRR